MKKVLNLVKGLFKFIIYSPLVNKNEKILLSSIWSRKFKNNLILHHSAKQWFKIEGDYFLRLDYPKIEKSDLVFDIGGYKGQFASDIYSKYNCYIYIFEPVKEFYNIIEERFSMNKNIKVFPIGLGGDSQIQKIYHHDNGTSIFRPSKQFEEIKIQSISEFVFKNDIKRVSLIKINIEGSEYDLLENLISNNLVSRFENIQVQFHPDMNNSWNRMNAIRSELCKTHMLTYSYNFIWDNYKLI